MSKPESMHGKTCLVTGATSGIGLYTALGLSLLGADVGLVGRSPERIETAIQILQTRGGRPPRHVLWADLSSLSQVRLLAEQVRERLPRLDVLVNNAGGVFRRREETGDGLERTFALNHLCPFLLTHLLLERMSSGSRIITVASDSHRSARIQFDDLQLRRGYNAFRAYANSKLGNIWFTYELARRLKEKGISANTLTPGMVSTNLGKQNIVYRPFLSLMFALFGKPPSQGAETPVFLASSPAVEGVSGRYFVDKRAVPSSPQSYDEAAARRMWEMSGELAGIG
ncbi:MAG: SDR family oxidoreductase [Anaerolineales bacterium]